MGDGSRQRLADLGAGALSGLLFALAFPPAGLSLLVFVALVPLLYRVRSTGGERVGWAFFGFGIVSFEVGLFWLRTVLTPFGPGLLGLLLTLLFVWPTGHAAGFLVRRKVSLLVAAPVAFLLSEWLRTWLFTGFPWLYLAHPLASFRPLVQVADLAGAYGVSLLVAVANAAIAEALFRCRRNRGVRAFLPLVWPAGLAVAFLGYGLIREASVSLRAGPEVLLVQGNIPQDEKAEAREGKDLAAHILSRHLTLMRGGVAAHPGVKVAIWPETMFPYLVTDADRLVTEGKEGFALPVFREVVAAAGGRPVILGALARTGERDVRNSVFLLGKDGVVKARYDKVHLVPGGEYIPLRTVAPKGLLKWVGERIQASAGFVPNLVEGHRLVLMKAAGVRFAPLVCYETCYPGLVRNATRAGADVLLNLSNYGWFPRTSEPDQALQYAIYRAIEARRPLVVAANTGISGIVSPIGEVRRLEVDGRDEDVAGTFAGRVPLTRARSFYVVAGDWLPIAALVLLVLVAARRLLAVRRTGSRPSSRESIRA